MIWIDFLFALIIALFFSAIIVLAFGWRRPDRTTVWPSLLFVFFLILMLTWIGGVWIVPFGPVLWGGYWLPFLFVGLFFAILFMALYPPYRIQESRRGSETEVTAGTIIGGFFWFLLLIVIIGLIVHYV